MTVVSTRTVMRWLPAPIAMYRTCLLALLCRHSQWWLLPRTPGLHVGDASSANLPPTGCSITHTCIPQNDYVACCCVNRSRYASIKNQPGVEQVLGIAESAVTVKKEACGLKMAPEPLFWGPLESPRMCH